MAHPARNGDPGVYSGAVAPRKFDHAVAAMAPTYVRGWQFRRQGRQVNYWPDAKCHDVRDSAAVGVKAELAPELQDRSEWTLSGRRNYPGLLVGTEVDLFWALWCRSNQIGYARSFHMPEFKLRRCMSAFAAVIAAAQFEALSQPMLGNPSASRRSCR